MAKREPQPAAAAALELPAFGLIEAERVLAEDELFVVLRDKYPVSAGHTLIIPRRAAQRLRELTEPEKARLLSWVDWVQQHLEGTLAPAPDAYNFGVNDGKAAGQTVAQFHFHVIPRFDGDAADPRGGVRWVIPAKARYW
jgi:diadenosine tetraphosphate (Ap4A) HIT family hydrolase